MIQYQPTTILEKRASNIFQGKVHDSISTDNNIRKESV